MKKTLKTICAGPLLLVAAVPLHAANLASLNGGFGDHELNAALGIPNAWLWLQNAIVPLASLLVFLGLFLILAEVYHRQNKMLRETLRVLAEKTTTFSPSQNDKYETQS